MPKKAPHGTLSTIAQTVFGSADSKTVRKVKYLITSTSVANHDMRKKIIALYLKEVKKHQKASIAAPVIKRVKRITL